MNLTADLKSKLTRKEFRNLKVIKFGFCYGEAKVLVKELAEFNCPFEFTEMKDACRQCRWYGEGIEKEEEMKEVK